MKNRVKPNCINKRLIQALFLLLLFTQSFNSAAQSTSRAKLHITLLLNLNGGSQNFADGVLVSFDEKFSTRIGNEDSYKFTNLDENLAIERNGLSLSIEGRPSISSNDTIPLKIWQFRQKNYCLRFLPTNFNPTLQAVLKDAYLNKDFPISLSDTTIIDFNLTNDSASFAANRFCVVFKNAASLPVTLSAPKAIPGENNVTLTWLSYLEENIEQYEIERSTDGLSFKKTGLVKAKGVSTHADYVWIDKFPIVGNVFYRIKAVEKSGKEFYTSIVFVDVKSTKKQILVYPNPVQGNSINLKISNFEIGLYMVVLVDLKGQTSYCSNFYSRGESEVQKFNLGSNAFKGAYFLHLIHESSISTTPIVFP